MTGENIEEQAELEMPRVRWRYSRSLLKQSFIKMVGDSRELRKFHRKQRRNGN